MPRPDEIPSGLCECGCGQKTKIVTRQVLGRRHFFGHPMPFLQRHGPHINYRKAHNHYRWKGGRSYDGNGYVRVWVGIVDGISQYEKEHRVVMEGVLGRKLLPEESVHHRNGVKDDNRPENLELWTASHPNGQRVADKLAWARELLATYEGSAIKR